MKISIETSIGASITSIWKAWTTPEAITQWNFASDDWCCPRAELDLKPGGKFSYRMEAKDASAGFDFIGEFTFVEEPKRLEFTLDDNRPVEVLFSEENGKTVVKETFEAEDMNAAEQQKQGWQNILNNFKKYAEVT